jgi:hypothetical protein
VETTSATAGHARLRRTLRLATAALVRLELPALAIWIGAGIGLASITRHVVDWFVMTDELLYERLAISAAHLHSPLPRVHGELIPNVSQLYPLLIAPVFRHGLVPASLHSAHVLNAYVMASAAVPAFLLARKLTGRRFAGYLAALLAVTLPWMVLASFLLTEVAAYPAFLWAVLALQHALVAPRVRNDVLALAGIALAAFARTQLVVLLVVLAPAIFMYELGLAEGEGRGGRVREATRRAVTRHRLLAVCYAALLVLVVGLAAAGRLSRVLGTYAGAAQGDLLPAHFAPSFAEHLALIALGLGVLPFVLGLAWLVTGLAGTRTPERRAFAAVGTLSVVVLTFEVTSFDLRFSGVLHDRYLFYLAPIVLIAFVASLSDRRWPRWSLLVPMTLLVYGFSQLPLPRFQKLNVDTPVAVLNDKLLKLAHGLTGARIALALGVVVLTALFVEGSLLLRRWQLAGVLAILTVLLLPAETGYAFARLFRVDGTSGRPLTLDQGVVFDWVDRTLGPDADVTMVPFPDQHGDYWAGVGYWWDIEFWNESVKRAAYLPNMFLWTPSTFPKLLVRIDPQTGRVDTSPSPYLLESDKEARFRIAGSVVSDMRDTMLIRAEQPWRAEWTSSGLYDDGWTKPGQIGRIRIFATPTQSQSRIRYLGLGVISTTERPFMVASNRAVLHAVANSGDRVFNVVKACVPAHGHTDVRVTATGSSTIYGDPRDAVTAFSTMREAGVLLTEIALANEIGPRC